MSEQSEQAWMDAMQSAGYGNPQNKINNPEFVPGLLDAADNAALSWQWIPQGYTDTETGQTYSWGGDWGTTIDESAKNAYIDNALKDPTKWVANNLNWSGLGDGGNFSALDDQIKFLKDNKYDLSALDKRGLTQYNLTKQIIGQGTTGRWTGQGFGSPVENAKHMASTLMTAGIEDIKDFGQVKKDIYLDNMPVQQEMNYDSSTDLLSPTGKYYYSDEETGAKNYIDPKYVRKTTSYDPEGGGSFDVFVADKVPVRTETAFGNKATQQAITQDYNQAYGNIFSGTYAGHGRTNFGVQFAADGTPYFYTQFGGDTSSMADIAPVLTILSIIPSPLQPFAAAANALIALDNGNTLGGLAALAGIPGVSEAASAAGLASVASGIQTANQVVNLVNALDSGNVLGAVAAGASLTGAGSTQITDGGMTVSDALKAANLVKAIDGGDPNAIFNATVGLTQSKTFQNSLNGASTTINSDGQKVSDIVGDNFVAEITNPNSENYLGKAEETLSDVLNSPSAQVATSDDNSALKIIEDLRSQGYDQKPSAESKSELELESESKDEKTPVSDTQDSVSVLGDTESQDTQDAVGVKSGAESSDIQDAVSILGDAQSSDLPFVGPTGPMGPPTEDISNRYKDEFANYLNYLQAGEPPPPDYGPGPIGMTGDYWDELDQNLKTVVDEGRLPSQWQPDEEGNYTYIDDDGSTITINSSGDVVHQTSAPEGNLPGETPNTAEPKPNTATTKTNIATSANTAGPRPVNFKPNISSAAAGLAGAGLSPSSDTTDSAAVKPLISPLAITGDKTGETWTGGTGKAYEFINPLSSGEVRVDPIPDVVRKQESNLPGSDDAARKMLKSKYLGGDENETDGSSGGEGNMMDYYSYGKLSEPGEVLRSFSQFAKGGSALASPLQAATGGVPHKGSHYVQGAGGGQDDLIDARLADGEYVFDADIVAALGDGSNKRGAEILDRFRAQIRKHKRSAPKDKIPPAAKSPLAYLKEVT